MHVVAHIHIHELHIEHVVGRVTGKMKVLEVALFRRLKNDWNKPKLDLEILLKIFCV